MTTPRGKGGAWTLILRGPEQLLPHLTDPTRVVATTPTEDSDTAEGRPGGEESNPKETPCG